MGDMTRIDLMLRPKGKGPTCVGVGFVAVDLVETDADTFAAVGGSCGNVVAILAWLGWHAAPVARLGRDWAADHILKDLTASGVDTEFLNSEDRVQSPIVIQRFVEDRDGQRTHRFSLTCPECGGWLPRYRPSTLRQAIDVIEKNYRPKAFYFDRVSPAALKLARWAKDCGAFIVFEPSMVGHERQFQNAVDICHVLKYSHDQLGHVLDIGEAKAPRIIIETLGRDGLRFRWRSRWTELPAYDVRNFRDAAGAGDWCTAGLIHRLGDQGASALSTLRKPRILSALRFGQALAAINCRFDGGRGAMLALSPKQMNAALARLSEPSTRQTTDLEDAAEYTLYPPEKICRTCVGNPQRTGLSSSAKRPLRAKDRSVS